MFSLKILMSFIGLASSVQFEEPIRTLRVAASQYEPFICNHIERFGQFTKGIELELIKMIAQKENFQLQFVDQPKKLQ